ncbi:right-handed parallel beta-helix repeat-containing protein [Streptomyces sp. S1A(2023)]
MIDGQNTVRDDAAGHAAIEGDFGTDSVIRNVWIQHTKVGLWVTASTNGLKASDLRIRNTYADGVNLRGNVQNTVVSNSSIRGTGDDAMAMWSDPGAVRNSAFRNNTIQLPTLANGAAVYGGSGNSVENNLISDTVTSAAGISVSNPVRRAVHRHHHRLRQRPAPHRQPGAELERPARRPVGLRRPPRDHPAHRPEGQPHRGLHLQRAARLLGEAGHRPARGRPHHQQDRRPRHRGVRRRQGLLLQHQDHRNRRHLPRRRRRLHRPAGERQLRLVTEAGREPGRPSGARTCGRPAPPHDSRARTTVPRFRARGTTHPLASHRRQVP